MNKIQKCLTVVLVLLLMSFPLSATAYDGYTGWLETGAFGDISDSRTAEAVAVLSALGILNGYPDGTYRPGETLTRGQFAKIAIYMLGKEDQVATASQKTLFSDVTSSHWAAGYVNLAYENGLLRGYGDGTFGPDNMVSYAETLTILLRLLGYTEERIGKVYPDDYLAFAASIGLSDTVYAVADTPLTRGECARLLAVCLETENSSGEMFYKKLYPRSVGDVILLDTNATSSAGKRNTVALYENGQTVWYQKAMEISSSLIDAHGTAIIDDNGKILVFLPDEENYRTVDGILLSNSQHTEAGEMPYEVVLYVNGSRYTYPRINTISANLVGASGKLILDENGYATAFLADDGAAYTITKNAVFLGYGDDGAEFYSNGKVSEYTLANNHAIITQVGSSGTILTNADGEVYAFIPEEAGYSILTGTVLETSSDDATFLINGYSYTYKLAGTLTGTQAGSSGKILVNTNGKVEAFLSDGTQGSVKTDVILLDNDCTSDTGERHTAMFLENGKTVYYEQTYGILNSYMIGYSGTLLLDANKTVTAFTPDGERYETTYGILLESSSSYATFLVEGITVECKVSGTVSANAVGQYGTLLLTANGRLDSFLPDESTDPYTITGSGILLETGELAVDGRTMVVKLYENGKIYVYRTEKALSAQYEGKMGRLLIDEDDIVAGFLEGETNSKRLTMTADSDGTMAGFADAYDLKDNTPVVFAGELISWKEMCDNADGRETEIYFDNVGSVEVIVVH